jgi:hypothetical protein
LADYKFKERCPCGDEVEFISYSSREMDSHVDRWRKIHRPHMTAIAKAIAENTKWPLYYMPNPIPGAAPQPGWWQNPIVTFETDTATGVTTQKGWPQYGGPKAEG